jgi:N-acetyl-gamma-glutamylphosphate reductase
MQLMLAPLIDKIRGPVNFFGISGYSGAGASPNPRNNEDLLSSNILAYTMINHLHEQEVKHQMYNEIFFTPHVAEFFRGIHMTGNIVLTDAMSADNAEGAFQNFYADMPLIKVQKLPPDLQQVRGTSFAVIGGFEADVNTKRLTFCCTIDNLLKGAATQAVQNLNSAFGWDDNLGIIE